MAKFALAFGLAILCWCGVRRHGAGLGVLAFLAPVAILLADNGFSTIRAQIYSFVLGASLLVLLDRDRENRRYWVALWLPLHLLWLNLHAGFVVGLGWLGLHWLEQLIRRRPHRHLLLTLIAATALVGVNPHGLSYFSYLWRALTLRRPLVAEWGPLWAVEQPHRMVLFAASLLLLAYVVRARGWRRMEGLPIVAVSALAAIFSGRMLPFYAIAWFLLVPGPLEQTFLGEQMERFWHRRRGVLVCAWCALAVISVARAVPLQPWRLRVPGAPIAGAGKHMIYPVGAVGYLKKHRFSGNLMVHFNEGAFVLWKLFPAVKVSIDSRYEVAYPPWLAEQNHRLYMAQRGWQQTLEAYATDAVLVPLHLPLAQALRGRAKWTPVYRDLRYALYARRGSTLPAVVRREEIADGVFP